MDISKVRTPHMARFFGMNASQNQDEICKEIAAELEDMANPITGELPTRVHAEFSCGL
jgi:hypothetical protein